MPKQGAGRVQDPRTRVRDWVRDWGVRGALLRCAGCTIGVRAVRGVGAGCAYVGQVSESVSVERVRVSTQQQQNGRPVSSAGDELHDDGSWPLIACRSCTTTVAGPFPRMGEEIGKHIEIENLLVRIERE